MKITGENIIAADKQAVWEALNDPEILRQSIPGCESLELVGENHFKATVVSRIGPITAKFNGEVILGDLDPPNGYTLSGSGTAGAMGGAKGSAKVTLETVPGGTLLKYDVNADLNGKIAQLGGRLIQSTAGVLAGKFFNGLSNRVAGATSGDANQKSEGSARPKWLIYAIVALASGGAVFIWLAVS